MSRTVRDSALLLQVLAGHDPRDATSLRDTAPDFVAAADRDVKGLRIGWSPDLGFAAADPQVVEAARQATQVFEGLGCSLVDANLAMESPFDAFWTLFSTNVAAANGYLLEERADDVTWYTRDCLKNGVKVTGTEYALAQGEVDRLKTTFADLFNQYDLLLTPTMAVAAFPVGEFPTEIGGREVHSFWGYLPYTFPINMVGHPAASIPCGFSSDGLPIGLHIIGRRGDEAAVIAASAAFERARPWIQTRPPVS